MFLPRILSAAAPRFGGMAASLLGSTRMAIAQKPQLAIAAPVVMGVRWATHKASRPANKGKDGPGKRLGAKKTAGETVRIGTIIYKQRGTVWFPGENAAAGRDHTIYATQPGYVRYYKDPLQPTRKFIGVAVRPEQKLPTPTNAASRRRLGKEEVPLIIIDPRNTITEAEKEMLSSGIYYYRPANWKLGLMSKEVPENEKYDKKNTWARWQKRVKRVKFAKSRRGIGGKDIGKPLKKKAAKRRV
ncbi:ribosomal L27 protein-domain-containing protein [Peziza echinospora]|nr:ribosomal L27 protein-domain-containing protein [Peziza echinospora]